MCSAQLKGYWFLNILLWCYASCFEVIFLIIKSTRTVITTNSGSTIAALWIKPATMYAKNEIAATVIVYGICVDTWFMWSHTAPADDIIVVSEIGEQWSPHTAPARQADIPIIISSESPGKIAVTIGIKIPNVPQDVPVEKARKQATRNIIAGRKFARPAAADFISISTYSAAPSRPVIFLRAVAKVKIKIAGTIALKPFEYFPLLL